ncbi:hypothetical protein FOXG_17003 [Fusarium oxysporum f. sp. lycopersici 4287]|uniref:SWI5-dependent HO expression protein 3 n=1 Tax=Fusarium oxysporum f. sp. lycopersici (strain 4287 / CBS 123668 / FGSC 9935 / NRRL 34936) TaxID=426428 RepID=A0A0J9WBA1_FUSO4|nr:uncharacterized protein FOXG_17003 [Fusarium oxysporum f. sp. lycopersici 4287]KNB19805.1 hypothetical protein FOXG_17003 [Fusarium oxysporum f. sp. lycopersici 4287]
MMFLELTAPGSPIAESASTISSEDHKLLVLTPPAPTFAETSNATSAGADVGNTDKVFNQMIAQLNTMRAKVRALESENKELKAQVQYEKSFKEHFSKNLDEANRNWHSTELEAAAKDAELGRVRERLNLVQLQAAEQEELHAVKEQNIELQARVRLQFTLTTHQHVQMLKHMMHDWKAQVEQKIDDDFVKNKADQKESASPIDADYERLKALIEGHEKIIANIKKGNDKFVTQIKDLREEENASLISDLTAERFEVFLYEREKMVAQLENEKRGFEQMAHDN